MRGVVFAFLINFKSSTRLCSNCFLFSPSECDEINLPLPYRSRDSSFILLNGSNSTLFTNSYLESPDELLEENFEEAFRDAMLNEDIDDFSREVSPEEDFSDIAKFGIVEVAGDDYFGRKIITIYACKLPPNKALDFNRLLK